MLWDRFAMLDSDQDAAANGGRCAHGKPTGLCRREQYAARRAEAAR